MDNVINFSKTVVDSFIDDSDTYVSETIFWCKFKLKDGSSTRFDLLKNKETKQIGIGILENYESHKNDDNIIFEDIILLSDDEDNFIYNKLNNLMENSITVLS
jgi:hypothetical protein